MKHLYILYIYLPAMKMVMVKYKITDSENSNKITAEVATVLSEGGISHWPPGRFRALFGPRHSSSVKLPAVTCRDLCSGE